MRKERQGYVYPPYRLSPRKDLVGKFWQSVGGVGDGEGVPPTYMIFLRGEAQGVDLFRDLDIPRNRALHGGQRYEWFDVVNWGDVLDVTATIDRITEKLSKSGSLWFADITYEYVNSVTKKLVLRELTRIIKRG